MPLSAMLFSFAGRLNRARFWLANIVLFMVGLVLLPIPGLSWVFIRTSPLSIAALVLVSIANLLVLFAGLAVVIKRLHDRDKSAWWLLLFYLVPSVLLTIAAYTDRTGTGAVEVRLILVLACLSIAVWFLVELGFLRGTTGPNRCGPDPLLQGAEHSTRAPARFATIALLTLSGVVLVAELLTLSGVVVVAESALPILRGLVQHGPWSGVHFAVSPRMPAAPNEAQSQPQPLAALNGAAESGVTGVWTAYDVGFPPWTLTLKADGIKLSGTVQQGVRDSSGYSTTLTMPVAIYDGEINGNGISFKCQDPRHDRTITFTGIVNDNEITFTRTVLVKPGGDPGRNGIFGASGAARFTAHRIPSGAASAEPDQGHADLADARFVNIDISGVANSELDWLLRPPRGHVKFDRIPFTVLSGDRSVIHMHNRVRPDYPSTLRFPIGAASVASVHLLLCGDWISNPGQPVGTVRIAYSDGSSRDVPLISLEDIRETWMPNFSLPGQPSARPPEGVTWKVAYSESQMRSGMASTAFLDRLSIRTDPARTITEVSFLTNEPQTGMILIAMTLEIAS